MTSPMRRAPKVQHCDAGFDFNFPFRPLLEFVRDRLTETSVSAELMLPEYIEFEDFVDGEMHLPDRRIGIYFEHSLSYVSFSSCRLENLKRLVSSADGLTFRHTGYGLSDAD